MENNKTLEERWVRLLRFKAREYEHKERKEGKTVCSPSLDDICNEIQAFFAGLNN